MLHLALKLKSIYCILETSNFVFNISSSESSIGNVESAIAEGIFSSTHLRSSSCVVDDFGLGDVLLFPPLILTPYASETNCSSSSGKLKIKNINIKFEQYSITSAFHQFLPNKLLFYTIISILDRNINNGCIH